MRFRAKKTNEPNYVKCDEAGCDHAATNHWKIGDEHWYRCEVHQITARVFEKMKQADVIRGEYETR